MVGQLVRHVVYTGLLVIITLRFACGEKKICSTIKRPQSIMNTIADWFEYANSMSLLTSYRFCPKIPFLGKFGPKNQNCELKMKLFTFSVFGLQVLSRKAICNFDVTWSISQQFTRKELNPVGFLVEIRATKYIYQTHLKIFANTTSKTHKLICNRGCKKMGATLQIVVFLFSLKLKISSIMPRKMSCFIFYISVTMCGKFFKTRSHDEALNVKVHLEEFILQ